MEVKEEVQNTTQFITEMICPIINQDVVLVEDWFNNTIQTVTNAEWFESVQVVVSMILNMPEAVESKSTDQSCR